MSLPDIPLDVRISASRRRMGFRKHIALHLPLFQQYLTETFAANHQQVCRGKDPAERASVVVIDGGAKVYRSICAYPSGRLVSSAVLQRMKEVPCGNQPRRGKLTCTTHWWAEDRMVRPKQRRTRRSKFGGKPKRHADDRCCQTDRERRDIRWHKTRGLLSAVHPCGIVADVREMFVHESRLQVCA